jgi:NAD(P)H dehydrogenase (quinone)
MTIAVTGATGQLGRLIIEALLARGVAPSDVVAGGRQLEKLDDLAGKGVRVAAMDYSDPAGLATAFSGVETVILVSASEIGARVAQHSAVIDAAKTAGVTRVVYTSAPQATTTTLMLAAEHKATEELLAASGLTTIILRNGWYTENYAQALDQAAATGEIIGSVGAGRVASASRIDFAEAAAVVVTTEGHDGAVYELSGDVAWDYPELAAAATEVLGRPVVYRDLSPEEHLAALTAAGVDEGSAGFVVALDQDTKAGLLAETSGDLSRLIGRLTTPLVDGLRALRS